MVRSRGSRSGIARRTVSPPAPESNTPIGRSSPTSAPRRKPIAEAGYRLQRDPAVSPTLELAPQPLHVGVYRMVVDLGQIAPDLVQQLGTGEDPAGVGRQQGQQVELGQRELDLALPHPHSAALAVD